MVRKKGSWNYLLCGNLNFLLGCWEQLVAGNGKRYPHSPVLPHELLSAITAK